MQMKNAKFQLHFDATLYHTLHSALERSCGTFDIKIKIFALKCDLFNVLWSKHCNVQVSSKNKLI